MTLHRCSSLLYGEKRRRGRSDRQESRRRRDRAEGRWEERRPMVRHNTGVKRAIKRDATARSPNLGCRSSTRDCGIEREPVPYDCRTSTSDIISRTLWNSTLCVWPILKRFLDLVARSIDNRMIWMINFICFFLPFFLSFSYRIGYIWFRFVERSRSSLLVSNQIILRLLFPFLSIIRL